MKVEEILKLAEMGYTKDEIEKMHTEEIPDKESTEEQTEQHTDDTEEDAQISDQTEVIKELMKQNADMLKTIKQIQADNAAAARQHPEEKKTAESVIKSFIQNL